jgi:hypothetical protein
MRLTGHDRQRKLHLPRPRDSSSPQKELYHLPKEGHICSTKVTCNPTSQSTKRSKTDPHGFKFTRKANCIRLVMHSWLWALNFLDRACQTEPDVSITTSLGSVIQIRPQCDCFLQHTLQNKEMIESNASFPFASYFLFP